MKLLLASAALATAVVIGVSTQATAVPPPPECQGNPHFCHGADEIFIEVEPAGPNCEFGGIRITVFHKPEPAPPRNETTTTTVEEPPAPEPEVFYVCNGAPGPPGEQGPPGEPGPPGEVLPPGTVLPITVTQDTTVNINISNAGNRRCRSVRERVRLSLPQRMRAEDTVRVKVDRERAISHEVIRDRFVRVNMRGKRCGAHLLQVRKVGIDPSLRLWTVTSATGINKRILVP